MKFNCLTKIAPYKDYGMFAHVYILNDIDGKCEKNIDDVIDFVKTDPFSPVMLHVDGFYFETVYLLKELSQFKEIWFDTDGYLFEDFAVMYDEMRKIFGISNIDVMIDALDDVIDLKKSFEMEEFVRFEPMDCPF